MPKQGKPHQDRKSEIRIKAEKLQDETIAEGEIQQKLRETEELFRKFRDLWKIRGCPPVPRKILSAPSRSGDTEQYLCLIVRECDFIGFNQLVALALPVENPDDLWYVYRGEGNWRIKSTNIEWWSRNVYLEDTSFVLGYKGWQKSQIRRMLSLRTLKEELEILNSYLELPLCGNAPSPAAVNADEPLKESGNHTEGSVAD